MASTWSRCCPRRAGVGHDHLGQRTRRGARRGRSARRAGTGLMTVLVIVEHDRGTLGARHVRSHRCRTHAGAVGACDHHRCGRRPIGRSVGRARCRARRPGASRSVDRLRARGVGPHRCSTRPAVLAIGRPGHRHRSRQRGHGPRSGDHRCPHGGQLQRVHGGPGRRRRVGDRRACDGVARCSNAASSMPPSSSSPPHIMPTRPPRHRRRSRPRPSSRRSMRRWPHGGHRSCRTCRRGHPGHRTGRRGRRPWGRLGRGFAPPKIWRGCSVVWSVVREP